MKVAVLSESGADEAALRVLVAGLLGSQIEPAAMPPMRSRGCAAVLQILPTVLRHLHYRTDAEGLIVVIDSDESTPHHPQHFADGASDPKCRLCQITETINDVQTTLRARQGMGPIKTAVGLPVPAIEAWYLAGKQPTVTEAAW